jgi:glutamate carboxypeptidase
MSSEQFQAPARSEWGADVEPLLERLDGEGATMVARTERWAAINSGSWEHAGLAAMRDVLANAFAALPGDVAVVSLQPSQRVRPDGEVTEIEHGEIGRAHV